MIDAKTVEHGAASLTYAASTSTIVIWGLQLSEWAAIVSTLIAVLGFVVHLWAQLRRERRAAEQHDLVMETLRHGAGTTFPQGSQEDTEGA